MGIVEHGGKVRAEMIPTPSRAVLVGKIREHVAADVKAVMTDEAAPYKNLGQEFPHYVVNHGVLEFVRGNVQQTLENYWSLLKRGIIGSFHQVSVKHLPRYLNEFSYRYNNRQDADLFGRTMSHLATTDDLQYTEESPAENHRARSIKGPQQDGRRLGKIQARHPSVQDLYEVGLRDTAEGVRLLVLANP
jgi:hypothetical protein